MAVAESQRMVRAAACPKGGETVKAQIRNAAKNLRLDYWTVWNGWQGKIGGRAFPKLLHAYHVWLDEQAGREIAALRERVARLEQDKIRPSAMAGESADSPRASAPRSKDRAPG